MNIPRAPWKVRYKILRELYAVNPVMALYRTFFFSREWFYKQVIDGDTFFKKVWGVDINDI